MFLHFFFETSGSRGKKRAKRAAGANHDLCQNCQRCRSFCLIYRYLDQLAQHLVDPSFLPNLEVLTINEHPSWPDFFQYIQQRQSRFLTGHIHTSLKRIITKKPVHGVLLEHLKESLAGKYIGLINMPPRRKGSKDWPSQPFDLAKLDADGILCCYFCHKAGLEIGCMTYPPINTEDPDSLWDCERHNDLTLNTVCAP